MRSEELFWWVFLFTPPLLFTPIYSTTSTCIHAGYCAHFKKNDTSLPDSRMLRSITTTSTCIQAGYWAHFKMNVISLPGGRMLRPINTACTCIHAGYWARFKMNVISLPDGRMLRPINTACTCIHARYWAHFKMNVIRLPDGRMLRPISTASTCIHAGYWAHFKVNVSILHQLWEKIGRSNCHIFLLILSPLNLTIYYCGKHRTCTKSKKGVGCEDSEFRVLFIHVFFFGGGQGLFHVSI